MVVPLDTQEMEVSGEKKKKRWSRKQLRASQGLLTQQAKTNIYETQAGIRGGFGSVRHGADIRVRELYEGNDDELASDEEDVKPPMTTRSSRQEGDSTANEQQVAD